jgi:hypothetical protein
MQIQMNLHLVALRWSIALEIPLFIIRLSILSHPHPLWCLGCKKKNPTWYLCLDHNLLHLVATPHHDKHFIITLLDHHASPCHCTNHIIATHILMHMWLVLRHCHSLPTPNIGLSLRRQEINFAYWLRRQEFNFAYWLRRQEFNFAYWLHRQEFNFAYWLRRQEINFTGQRSRRRARNNLKRTSSLKKRRLNMKKKTESGRNDYFALT